MASAVERNSCRDPISTGYSQCATRCFMPR
jgi:hypothetical protein